MPSGFVLAGTFPADQGLRQSCGQGRTRVCPVAGQPELAPQSAAWQGSRGTAGSQRLGSLLSPRQRCGSAGICNNREASYSAEHPRVPPALALPGRWQRAGPGQDKARSSGGRSRPGPGAGLGRARLRAGGTPAPPRGGPVFGGERMERKIKGAAGGEEREE